MTGSIEDRVDLFKAEPVKEDYLSPAVHLCGFRAFRRVCEICLDDTKANRGVPLTFSERRENASLHLQDTHG